MSSNYQEVQENKNINKQILEKKMRVKHFKFVWFKKLSHEEKTVLRLYFPFNL